MKSSSKQREKSTTPLVKDLFGNSEEKKLFGMSPNSSFKIITAKD